MKKRLFSLFLFLAVLAVGLVLAVSCDDGDKGDGGSDYADARPTIELPADAAALDALILSIDGATRENEDEIDLAYLGYCALPEEERAKVLHYDAMMALRRNLSKEYVVKKYHNTRIDHSQFLIGAYICQEVGPNIYTDLHMEDMAACLIDFTWQADKDDQHYRYGIGTFQWAPVTGLPIPIDEEGAALFASVEEYRAAVKDVSDHPAIWGIFQEDETNAQRFSYYDELHQAVLDVFPGCAQVMCLLPEAAGAARFGTFNYKSYLSLFAKNTTSDFLCINAYPYYNATAAIREGGHDPAEALVGYLENLDIAADQCLKSDLDFWSVMQVNSMNPASYTVSEDMMRFQAYSYMGYSGAKSVSWACWIEGWWEENVLNDNGQKGVQYYKIRTVNEELKALAPVYMRYSLLSNALHVGEEKNSTAYRKFLQDNMVEELTYSTLSDLCFSEEDVVAVGTFKKNVGDGEAFMFIGCDDIWFDTDVSASVTFKTADPASVVTAYVRGEATVLNPDENGVYTVEIVNADAVFVTVE